MRSSWRWLLLILVVVTLYYWKIAFTHQFSMLTGYEPANQAYAWDNYEATSLHKGHIPLWDPNTQSGHPYIGEMQPGLFYPPKLLLYFWPLNSRGLFSPSLFHSFHILTHVMAAFFLFLLAREAGLGAFPAFVAGLTFSLSGFTGKVNWPHLLDAAIWLPLLLLFTARALGVTAPDLDRRARWRYACAAGLALGMSALAGSVHLMLMQTLAVTGFVAYFALARRSTPLPRAAIVLALIAVVSFATGAVQLLPSVEYTPHALRYLGGDMKVEGGQRILYHDLQDGNHPSTLMGLVMGFPFAGAGIGEFPVYLGVLALLLALGGAWWNWGLPWVRYLAMLALLSLYYSLGSYSLLHGLAYAVVPFLWIAREAGRFIYLTHFAMALLAGFGVQALLNTQEHTLPDPRRVVRILGYLIAGVAFVLMIFALTGTPQANDWAYTGLFEFACAWAVLYSIVHGWRSNGAKVFLVAVLLADFAAYHWSIRDYNEETAKHQNYLDELLQSQGLADFLHRTPDLFRVAVQTDWPSNIGDVYRVQTTGGMAATTLKDYEKFEWNVPHSMDILNVRFFLRRSTDQTPGFVFNDKQWKVYENSLAFPRAWMVRQVVVEPSSAKSVELMKAPDFDARRTAVSADAMQQGIPSAAAGTSDAVTWESYESDALQLRVHAEAPALLVVSEMHYPGWVARREGQKVPIHLVDSVLRGVEVPAGDSRIRMSYEPRSVRYGAVLTLLALLGVPLSFLGNFLLTTNRKSR